MGNAFNHLSEMCKNVKRAVVSYSLTFLFTPPPSQSKGGILSKACDYIKELRQSNHTLHESLHEVKRVQMDNEILRQQVSPPATSSAPP